MKVCLGAGGRFYIFELAQQMARLGHLGRLYTGYPIWKVDEVPWKKVSTFPWLTVPALALGRVGSNALYEFTNRSAIKTFAQWMAAHLEPCDVFHALSSFGLEAQRAAKERSGALTVCDRGSSHILYQDRILAAEYGLWGLPYRPIHQEIVDRELEEYAGYDLITVPSTFAYRSFVEQGVPASKLRKVPFGVDLRLFRPVPKEDSVFRVIYVGALSVRKGLPHLLQALEALRLPQFEVWFVGAVAPEGRAFLAKHKGPFRHFGILPRKKLFRYYSQGSVFVLPSVEEGLALVQAQAMACGLPVIATTNTGAEDLFTDGVEGFVVPIRSPQAISEKITHLYEHPEVREQMARAALARVRELGGWDAYGQAMASVYESGLAELAGKSAAPL